MRPGIRLRFSPGYVAWAEREARCPGAFNHVIVHERRHAGARRATDLTRHAQLVTLDLSRRGLRQLGDELDPARVFVVCELLLHVLLDSGGERGARGVTRP